MTDSTVSVDQLQAIYPFGSIYLTYIPLNDLTSLLNEKDKFAQLATAGSRSQVLLSLKTFLNSEQQPNMNEALAFIQLDLKTGQAGFKKMSDRNATISKIAWDESTVREISWFSDQFLKRLVDFEEKHSSIASGQMSVDKAWATVQSLKEDPFIPTRRTFELTRDFRSVLASKPDELEGLRLKNQDLYSDIQSFSTHYDHSLTDLKQALKPLGMMIRQASDAGKKLSETYYHCRVQSRQLRDRAASSAGLFISYLNAVQPSDEGIIEVYQNLVSDFAPPGIAASGSPWQLSVCPGKLIVALGAVGKKP